MISVLPLVYETTIFFSNKNLLIITILISPLVYIMGKLLEMSKKLSSVGSKFDNIIIWAQNPDVFAILWFF